MLNNEYKNSSLKIFSLKGNEPLAQEVADRVGIELGNVLLNALAMEKFKSILKKVFVDVMFSLSNQLQIRLIYT